MNSDNERDALWDLLGKAKAPGVSPFFARNVLREIRRQQEKPGVFIFLARRWRLALFGAVAVLVAAFVAIPRQSTQMPTEKLAVLDESASVAEAASRTEPQNSTDYELIAKLDDALASVNHAIWLDNSGF